MKSTIFEQLNMNMNYKEPSAICLRNESCCLRAAALLGRTFLDVDSTGESLDKFNLETGKVVVGLVRSDDPF